MASFALGGVRVLDLTQVRAGPKAARWLADAGAEVIKVESRKRPDGRGFIRGAGGQAQPVPEVEQRKTNRQGFEQLHRNKLGLSVDLTDPEGKGIFKRLVTLSDVVMENFSFGVMNRLGLGYGELSRSQPELIMISMPAFGGTGPDRDYVGFGWAQEHLGGVSAMTGYRGGPPLRTGVVTPDPLNGVHAAAAVMTALVHRLATGKGQFIDFSHWESMIALVGDWVLEYAFNGTVAPRIGNRHRVWAPQGVYRCQGEDRWVSLTVTCREEWGGLCHALGQPQLIDDLRFASPLERHHNSEALDIIIEEWTRQRSSVEAMEELQRAGVPAGAVFDNGEVWANPHTKARGLLEWLTHPDGVEHPYIRAPWRFSRTPSPVRFPAPLLGEHTTRLLKDLLALPDDEIARLETRGVTATLSTQPGQGASTPEYPQ